MENIKAFFNKPIVRNILAVLSGSVLGGLINGLIVKFGAVIIPYPEGYSYATEELMKSTIHLLEPKHYIVPFLAHALGTLIGCIIVFNRAFTNHFKLAFIVSTLFFFGGAMMVKMLWGYTPMWFNITDLVFAYFPMAFIAKFLKNSASVNS